LEVFGGLRVSPSPCRLSFHHELAKATYQKIFSALQIFFHDLEKFFHDNSRLAFAESNLIVNAIDDLFFG
jgi:hypothetical protein